MYLGMFPFLWLRIISIKIFLLVAAQLYSAPKFISMYDSADFDDSDGSDESDDFTDSNGTDDSDGSDNSISCNT